MSTRETGSAFSLNDSLLVFSGAFDSQVTGSSRTLSPMTHDQRSGPRSDWCRHGFFPENQIFIGSAIKRTYNHFSGALDGTPNKDLILRKDSIPTPVATRSGPLIMGHGRQCPRRSGHLGVKGTAEHKQRIIRGEGGASLPG